MESLEKKVYLLARLMAAIIEAVQRRLRSRGRTNMMRKKRIISILALAAALVTWLIVAGCSGGGFSPVTSGSGGSTPTPTPTPTPQKIYITDSVNQRIVRMDDMLGTGWTTFSGTINGTKLSTDAWQVWVDALNRIYVADKDNNRIVRMNDISGTGAVEYATDLSIPCGISVDSSYRIYISDTGNNRIVRISDMTGANRQQRTTWGANTLNLPVQMYVKSDGSILYIADLYNTRIVALSNVSGDSASWTWNTPYTNPINYFSSVSLDSAEKIYMGTDGGSTDEVVRINSLSGDGYINYPGPGAGFTTPISVALDSTGKIYTVDYDKHTISRFDDMTGTNIVSLGSFGSAANQFKYPISVYVK